MNFDFYFCIRAFGISALALSSGLLMAQNTPAPFFPLPQPTVSTVPPNGDVNPYGVAFVPKNFAPGGVLNPGDVLVSNFNNAQNLQGTGTTIVRITPNGQSSVFFQGNRGLGLTAALGIVRGGFVFAGNTPTADGTSATVTAGSVLVLNSKGQLVGTLTDPKLVDGPWGMAVRDLGTSAQIFFSNVLNGTITRLDVQVFGGAWIQVRDAITIASGYAHRTDPAALVLGPSGLVYNPANDTLYVASSAENAVFAIAQPGDLSADGGRGQMIYQDNTHLHGPIDLVIAPSGHLIVANSDGSNADPNQPSELVEFTPNGQFVSQYSVDPNNGGAFGVGVMNLGDALRFAAVDDNANALKIWTVVTQ